MGGNENTNPALRIERRRYRRYIVRGMVRFRIDSIEVSGDLVNFGQGGMLIRSSFVLPEGTQLPIQVVAFCYPYSFAVPGRVVGAKGELMAIKFLQIPDGVTELLHWLERENVPWTGTYASGTFEPGQTVETKPPAPPKWLDEKEWESALSSVYLQS